MTLLAPLALLFGLSALVPLVLHLYHRRHRTVVVFSTTRFFNASILRSQRRLQLQRLLLLLLRVAACLLLALALSRPVLSAFSDAKPGTRDVVILLDDSLSMQATGTTPITTQNDNVTSTTPNGVTRFERARQLAIDAIDDLTDGDRVAVITFSGVRIGDETRHGVEPTANRLRVAEEVRELNATLSGGDAFVALQTAVRTFEAGRGRSKLMFVISDFQAKDWQPSQWPQPTQPVATALIDVGSPTPHNITIDELAMSQESIVVGQPNMLRVRLVNHDQTAVTTELVLKVDDMVQQQRTVQLPAGAPTIERIPLTFTRSGQMRVSAEIVGHDDLNADNALYTVVDVIDRLAVLIVDGDPEGARASTFYLKAALRAVGTNEQAVITDVVPSANFKDVPLDHYRVVLLANVAQLDLSDVSRLEQFVEAGGGLAIFVGPNANREFYNTALAGASRPFGGLLPGKVGMIVSNAEGDLPFHILQADLSHPVLRRFSGELRSALATVDVYRAFRFEPSNAWVVATLNNDQPFITERAYGDGRVMCFTLPMDSAWTDLPLRGVVIPLINRSVNYLAGADGTKTAGITGSDLFVFHGIWKPNEPLYVMSPNEQRRRATIVESSVRPGAILRAAEIDAFGFYEVEIPKTTIGNNASVIAVNTPRAESDTTQIMIDDVGELTGLWRVAFTHHVETSSLSAAISDTITPFLSGESANNGIWDTLLWLTLLAVLAEPIFANRAGRRKTRKTIHNERRAA